MGSVKMSTLNERLMGFLSSYISKDPSCNLTPVFDDYRCHVANISAKCNDQAVTLSDTEEAPAATSPASASAGE